MAYRIVIANQKGGVAKTTTAVNLADALMYLGYKVLLIDMDPQCNSTSVYISDEEEIENTVLDVILEKKSIKECIIESEFGDIIAGSRELTDWDGQLLTAPGGTKRLKKALKNVDNIYDFIVCDTPPNLGASMRNALFAASGIICPLPAKRFAVDGLASFFSTVEELKEDGNEDLEILGVLLTMYDKRNKQDREIFEELPKSCKPLGIRVLKTPIRVCQDIENAIAEGESLFRYKGSSNGAADYADFVAEILKIINKKGGRKKK